MKSIFPLLLLPFVLDAQPARVQIFNSVIVAGPTAPISTLGAIGHQVFLQASAQPTKTCIAPQMQGQLEFSFDNNRWIPFGSPQVSLFNFAGTSQIFSGSSSYDYVRFNLASFDTVNCQVNGWYMGSAQALLTSVSGSSVVGGPVKVLGGLWTENPITVGGVGDSGFKLPFLVCDRAVSSSVTAAQNLVLQTPGNALISIRVCSITVSSTAAAQVNLAYANTGTSCVTSLTSILPAIVLSAATGTIFLGSAIGPLLNIPGGTDLCVSGVSGTATVTVTLARTTY